MYVPETPFQATDDATMVYTLRQEKWHKGKPVMCNDVTICVTIRDEILRREIAGKLVEHLNKAYPCASAVAEGAQASGDSFEVVSKEEFDQWTAGRKIRYDTATICEPPMTELSDPADVRPWPDRVLAKIKQYDGSEYHGGRSPVYYIRGDLRATAAEKDSDASH